MRAAQAETTRHADAGKIMQATVSVGLHNDFIPVLLFNRAKTVGSCSKPHMVRMKGLEPSRLAALAPKASVSTNSTTSACV